MGMPHGRLEWRKQWKRGLGKMGKTVRIGTRDSALAIVQAQLVARAIEKESPGVTTTLVPMKTTGDKILDKTLDKVGGKGLFIKELDQALRRGEVDICVHSYKDMPMEDNPELPVVAVGERENPRDVLILPQGEARLSPDKPIGCSSQRRRVQLGQLYPGQAVAPVRGNILTRLEKLDRGEYSALVLAAAGIKRLGLWQRVERVFSVEELLPAGCQGALAVQGRAGEDHSYLNGFRHEETRLAACAERAFIRYLGCDCGSPVGVYGEFNGGWFHLRGMLCQNGVVCRDELRTQRGQAENAGQRLAEAMEKGAGAPCAKADM